MSTTPATAAVLLVEVARRGIELRAAGDRLRYRPRSAMTPALDDRLAAHRGDLLAILAAAEADPAWTVSALPTVPAAGRVFSPQLDFLTPVLKVNWSSL